MTKSFRVGVVFPQTEIEADAKVIGHYAQAVEGMGYSHLVAYDHVLGAGLATRPDFKGFYTYKDSFHEPLTLFSYLAGLTKKLTFMSGVVVLPQRQTALFAKQAANVDIFCGGRLRIGVGVGWNDIEYEALGMPFAGRGARMDDQIRVLRRLWTEPTITEDGPFHKITDAGLNPLPIQRPIPIWVGGFSEAAVNRAARLGDGWFPAFNTNEAEKGMAMFDAALKKAGRTRSQVQIENNVLVGQRGNLPDWGGDGTADSAARDAEVWRNVGADGMSFDTTYMGFKSADQHLEMLRRIAGNLNLKA